MGKLLRIRLTTAGLAVLMLLASCNQPKVDTLLSIAVSPNKINLLTGGMQPLGVNVSYASGTIKPVANWTCTSSNPAVAILSADGYIKAIAAGSTNLTLVYQENGISKQVTIPVQVTQAPKHPDVYYISE